MTLDFNKPLLAINGSTVVVSEADPTPVLIGQVVADLISKGQSENPIKIWDWALKLHDGKTLDLDPTDLDLLESTIKKMPTSDCIKAQALLIVRAAK